MTWEEPPGEALGGAKVLGQERAWYIGDTAGVERERVHTQEVRFRTQQMLHQMASLNRMENRGHMTADQGWEQ